MLLNYFSNWILLRVDCTFYNFDHFAIILLNSIIKYFIKNIKELDFISFVLDVDLYT
jgi:hypothetical protein